MARLSEEEIGRFRRILEAERDAIEARIAARDLDISDTVREESGVGDHGDESTRLYDREDQEDANITDRETLTRIKRALDRIRAGTYGLSEVSNKPIPVDRLEAVPYASTLVDEEPLEPD